MKYVPCDGCGISFDKDNATRVGKDDDAAYFCPKCVGSFEDDVAEAMTLCLKMISIYAFINDDKISQCRECKSFDVENHEPGCRVAEACMKAASVLIDAQP